MNNFDWRSWAEALFCVIAYVLLETFVLNNLYENTAAVKTITDRHCL